MKTAALAFAAATATGTVLTPVVRDLANRLGFVDHAISSRKIHKTPIPRVGGIAIVIAFFVPLAAILLLGGDMGARFAASPSKAVGLFGGGLLIAALGVLDDLKGVRARHKLAVQLLAAGFAYACGYRIDHIALPFGPDLSLGFFGLPFTVFWIAGVINALNLIDGLDGLAGGVALVATSAVFAMAAFHGQPLMLVFAAALAGATLGFLVYNFNPATVFMGDTGSMFLGFVLATTAIRTSEQASSNAVALTVPVLLLGIPIGDTLLAMGRRTLRGVPMFQADRGHIHHRLLDRGLTQRQAVLVLYAFSMVLSVAAVALTFVSSWTALVVLGAVGAVAYTFLRGLGFFDLRHTHKVLEARRRNLQLRAAVRRVAEHLRVADTHDEVFTALQFAAAPLGASAIALRLPVEAQREEPDHFSVGFEPSGWKMFCARYGLAVERPGHRQIELGWTDGRKAIDRDTEIAIELLCEHLADALERIDRSPEDGEISNIVRLIGWRKSA